MFYDCNRKHTAKFVHLSTLKKTFSSMTINIQWFKYIIGGDENVLTTFLQDQTSRKKNMKNDYVNPPVKISLLIVNMWFMDTDIITSHIDAIVVSASTIL